MKSLIAASLLALALGSAQATTPTAASVEALLEVTKVEATLDAAYAAMEPMMRQMMRNSPQRQGMSAEQLRMLDALPSRVAALLREEFAFAQFKPHYISLYQEVFTQDEVDAQLAFYRSPAGQAVISKTPLVVQKSMALSQANMQRMLPRMQQLLQQMLREAQAAR
jgi:uncharacterized protein